MFKLKTMVLILSFFSLKALATPNFTVDSMIKVSNKVGSETFTLTNTAEDKIYISGEIYRIELKDGEIEKTKLTRDNFSSWDLSLHPRKAIMEKGEVRDFSVKYLCEKQCDRSKDLVYQVVFEPALASSPDTDTHNVSMIISMGPYYIIPALNQKVDFDWDYNKERKEIRFKNTGNTFLRVEFNHCSGLDDTSESRCRLVRSFISGRERTISFPPSFGDSSISVTVVNHDESFKKTFTL